MSQFSSSFDDASPSGAPGNGSTSPYVPAGWPFSFGAPIRVNAWGAPIFPQASASLPSSIPSFAWPFAPPASSRSASSLPSPLPDWWIASRSLLGAIPRELNKPVGSDGLLGRLAELPNPGFFPSDEIGIRNGVGPGVPNPSADSASASTAQPPAAARWYGFGLPAGVNAWGSPEFAQSPPSSPLFGWPFTPRETARGASGEPSPLADASAAERSLLGLPPRQQDQAPGNYGLTPGQPVQPFADGGLLASAATSPPAPWWLQWLGRLPAPSDPLSAPAQLLWGVVAPNSGRTAIEAGRRGLAEGASDTAESMAIVRRGLQGQPAFQDGQFNQSGTDEDDVGQLLQQPISEGWFNPDWWAANLAFAVARSSPSTAFGLVGMGIGSEARPGWGTAIGAAAGYGLGTLFQTLAPAYQRARTEGLDHEAAVDRALKETAIASTFAGAIGGAPGVSIFGKTIEGAVRRPISELLAQIFAVQPALATAQDAATRAVEDKPITAGDLLSDYASSLGNSLLFGGGQSALRQWRGSIWWNLPLLRGRTVELRLGPNLHPDHPGVDVHDPDTGAITSIKSIDLRSAGYRGNPASVYSKLRGAVDKLAAFESSDYAGYKIEEGSVSSRTLLVAVPKFRVSGQQDALDRLIDYGAKQGVTVKVVVLR